MDRMEAIFGKSIDTSVDSSSWSKEDAEKLHNEIPTTLPMGQLASRVINNFQIAARHRRSSGVDQMLIEALLAQTTRYAPEQEAKMRRAGISPKVFVPITSTKIRAAKALLTDIFGMSGEWPFKVQPSPIPDLSKTVTKQIVSEIDTELETVFEGFKMSGIQQLSPLQMKLMQQIVSSSIESRWDEIMNRKIQFARIRASRMEAKVQDIMNHGGWDTTFRQYVNYICIYGTGLIIGPEPRVVPFKKCIEEKNGSVKYVMTYKQIPTYEAVNPFDCYPAPNAENVKDGPLCIRVKYTSDDLWQFIRTTSDKEEGIAKGWLPETVHALLEVYPNGGLKLESYETEDADRRAAEMNASGIDTEDCTLEGIRCFDSIQGKELIELGITQSLDGKVIKYGDYYQVEVIVIGSFVVYCRIIDNRMGRPVSKGVFYELPGSWWGESIARKLYTVQTTMNNTIKDLLQNMAIASGPLYYINDFSRMLDKSPEGLKFHPHDVKAFQGSMNGTQGAPIGVINIPSNVAELLAVWKEMKIQSDDDSGIPAYTYGQSSGQGALRTASGLAIFSEAASRGMKMVIGTTDEFVIRDQVKKTCEYVLLYDDDMDLKGDVEVRAAGIMGKILKAQQDQQRLQVLGMVTNNQALSGIIGPRGICALFRPSIQDVNINPDDVLPNEEKMRRMELVSEIQQISQAMQAKANSEQAAMQQAAAQGGAQEAGPGQDVPPAPSAPTADVSPETAPPGGVRERRSVA